jgi:thiol-disulfide isomerase/thioredoxin
MASATGARVAVIKFSASWCGPCRACAPAYHRLKEEIAPGHHVDFYEVDVDQDDRTSSAYKVQSLPTFVLLLDGLEVQRIVGANVDQVRKELFRLLDGVPPLSAPHGKQSSPSDEDSDEQAEGIAPPPSSA